MFTFYRKTIDNRTSWHRYTTEKGPDWDEAYCLGPNDTTKNANLYLGDGAPYNGEECSFCYLHISHTSAIHGARISDHRKAIADWKARC
jgi:hypothetical protein